MVEMYIDGTGLLFSAPNDTGAFIISNTVLTNSKDHRNFDNELSNRD
jgi:hypothetical protein